VPDATAAVVSGVSVDSTILQCQVALVDIDAAAMTVGASGVPADSAVVQCQAALLDTYTAAGSAPIVAGGVATDGAIM